ncbi:uncharacterized protein LOC131051241 isoform X1 [Cryptomeria japonica]|uniref:uncharacterized protein LOC131051241 isoform X1 n=1 Tax=Cryptomeria japonica TaxID=3369 RepID=UPI0025AD6D75|nr:uncharacterized protein LOC131051241 isoform X1 [Cryptomeria japonica]XP_057841641.1 uncharacterized protein LOC131051241 isoform X1 [Cryptomeria japonica]
MGPHQQIDCGHNRFLACFAGGEEHKRSSDEGCACGVLSGSKNKEDYTNVVHRDFVNSTLTFLRNTKFTNHEALPSLHDAYAKFIEVYPKYEESRLADDIRGGEYNHLKRNDHVCMDYFGMGLFSHLQQELELATSSFNISYTKANLSSQARYGAPEKGSLEDEIKNRIFSFMNIMESNYSLVFTSNRGSAFKILAESYPFNINKRLLTVYDYESEGLNLMIETSKQKGAKVMSAYFKWPSLRICSAELRKMLVEKKKRKNASAKGLFVFPVQSKLTGAKYSYQWMNKAQEKGWHVLLDACALGSKDMDSLGLSLFQPDFIISSFFKVYGTDPTGFGCLFVKKSSVHVLDNSAVTAGVGMVNIMPIKRIPLPVSSREGEEEIQEVHEKYVESEASSLDHHKLVTVSSFSGPVSILQTAKRKEILEHEESESDHYQTSGTESAMETEPGVEMRKSKHHRPRRSFDSISLVLSDEEYTGDDDSRHQKLREQKSSSVQEIKKLEEVEEWQKQSDVVSEQEKIYPKHPIESSELQERETRKLREEASSSVQEIEELEDKEEWQKQSDIISEQGKMHVKYPVESLESREEREERELKDKGSSTVQELEGLEDTEEWQKHSAIVSEQEKTHPKYLYESSESPEERDTWKLRERGSSSVQEIEELEEEEWQRQSAIVTEQGEIQPKYLPETSDVPGEVLTTSRMTSWSPGETSQTAINTPIDYKPARKMALAEIFEKDQENSFDESTPTEDKKSSIESESVNSSEEPSRDPLINCRSLDHADCLGLITINNRLRYLINWLVSALMQLRHPSSEKGLRLVKIYGPKIKFERGAAVAFNLYDWKGELVDPLLVQRLADRSDISVSCGFLCNFYFPDKHADKVTLLQPKHSNGQGTDEQRDKGDKIVGLAAVTASLSFLSNFEDVYRLWVFIAKFLDADFVVKEIWRYRSLNQQTVEI